MNPELDALETKVKAVTTVKDSAVALIKGLAEQIRAGAGDKAKMLALATELDQDAADLGQAVTDNTPATP